MEQGQGQSQLVSKTLPRLAITQSELFAAWPVAAREKLIAAADSVRLPAGAILHRPGDAAEFVFLVAAGSLRIFLHASNDREFILRLCFAGDFHGIGPIISEVPCIYTASCREETHLVRVPGALLLDMARRDGRLAVAMFAALTRRHRGAIGLYAEAATRGLRARIATMLHVLITRDHSRDSAELYILQNELAEMLGSSRQVVNRELRLMQEDGIVRLNYGRISVADRGLLRSLVSSGPGGGLMESDLLAA